MNKKQPPKGIGGWMILFQIGFWWGLLLMIENIIYFSNENLILNLILSIISSILILISIILMYSHKKQFVLIAIITLWFIFLMLLLESLTHLWDIIIQTIPPVLWTIYLIKSKRVKNTFVK